MTKVRPSTRRWEVWVPVRASVTFGLVSVVLVEPAPLRIRQPLPLSASVPVKVPVLMRQPVPPEGAIPLTSIAPSWPVSAVSEA